MSLLSKSRRVLRQVDGGFVLKSAGRPSARTLCGGALVVCVLVAWVLLRAREAPVVLGTGAVFALLLTPLAFLLGPEPRRPLRARIDLRQGTVFGKGGERVELGRVRGLVLWWEWPDADARCELQVAHGEFPFPVDPDQGRELRQRLDERGRDAARVVSERASYRAAAATAAAEVPGGDAFALLPPQRLTLASGTPAEMLQAARELSRDLRVPVADAADRAIRVATPAELELSLIGRLRAGLGQPERTQSESTRVAVHRGGGALELRWKEPWRVSRTKLLAIALGIWWTVSMPRPDSAAMVVGALLLIASGVGSWRVEVTKDRMRVHSGPFGRTVVDVALIDLTELRARVFPRGVLDIVTRDAAVSLNVAEPDVALTLETLVVAHLARTAERRE